MSQRGQAKKRNRPTVNQRPEWNRMRSDVQGGVKSAKYKRCNNARIAPIDLVVVSYRESTSRAGCQAKQRAKAELTTGTPLFW